VLVAHCKALEARGPIASHSAGPPGPAALLLALEGQASVAVTRRLPALHQHPHRHQHHQGWINEHRWVQRFTPEFIEAARPCRHAPGDRWFADETYVQVSGRWTYLYRAIDQHGQVIDVLLSMRRDLAAARRFFTRAMRAGVIPVEVTTDRAPAYPRVLDELIPSALHTVERYANNPNRGRSRAAQSLAPADALAEAAPLSADSRRRSRLRPETCAAATMTSPPTSPPVTSSALPSTSSP
jgi:DDE domain